MTSRTIIAYGGSLERSDDGVTFTRIPEVSGIAIPQTTTEYQDVTSLDSEGGFREYIKGLKDAGEVTVPMRYTADGYEQMVEDQNAADAIYYRATMRPQRDQSTGDVFEFRAFPTPELEANDLGTPVGINLQLRMTGAPSWTRGAPI